VQLARQSSEALSSLSDGELRKRFEACRDELSSSWPPHSSEKLTRLFAVIDQAVRRALGLKLHDVQLVGAQVLASGQIAEMQTGEGKTIVAAIGAVALAAGGHPVHVVTSNAYLAGRDCREMTPLFQLLGLRVAELPEQPDPKAKRAAYASDVVYGTGYELGFDYLRDELTLRRLHELPLGERTFRALMSESGAGSEMLRRPEGCVIVDEADHVLLDEANSALILSEATPGACPDAEAHAAARHFVSTLTCGVDFLIDEAINSVRLTSGGHERAHAVLSAVQQATLLRPWSVYVEQAIRAQWLLLRDVHYVVREGKIRIVHEATGRILESHLWQDGLHQAVEAKERLTLTSGSRTAARISRQRYFRRYRFACGMTGTATGVSEIEFRQLYHLPVAEVPRRVASRRAILPPRYFVDQAAKWEAIADDVSARHQHGQPVLIGTRTIVASEQIAEVLRTRGVPFALLNGKQDAAESEVVAQAGHQGAVTIATNMAGRGTDIRLSAESQERGGLHVVLSEPHESTRVDRQLIGRSARQADPGSAQSFCAMDDMLITRSSPRWSRRLSAATKTGELSVNLSSEVLQLQTQAERTAFRHRKLLFEQESERDQLVARLHGSAAPSSNAGVRR
jgi:preprotein translocase subunit SecA